MLPVAPIQEGPRCVPASALYIAPGLDVGPAFAGAGGNHLVGVSIPDFWKAAGYSTQRVDNTADAMQRALLHGVPLHVLMEWDDLWDHADWTGLPPRHGRGFNHAFVIYGWLEYDGSLLWRAATTLPNLQLFNLQDEYRSELREVWSVIGAHPLRKPR